MIKPLHPVYRNLEDNMLSYAMWMQSANSRLWESTGQTTRFLQQIKYEGEKKDEKEACELSDVKGILPESVQFSRSFVSSYLRPHES